MGIWAPVCFLGAIFNWGRFSDMTGGAKEKLFARPAKGQNMAERMERKISKDSLRDVKTSERIKNSENYFLIAS